MKIKNQDITLNFFANSAVAIFIINPEHELIFWNKACEKLTGIPAHDILNTKDFWQAFYDEPRPCLADIVIDGNYDDLPLLYKKYGKSKLSHEGIYAEGWYEGLGGKTRYITFEAVPIFNESGEIVAAVETLHDYTEMKQLEQERETLISDLSSIISKNDSLKGFIPICSSCKKIRDKDKTWVTPEEYFRKKFNLLFSHGICPGCLQKLYPEIKRND